MAASGIALARLSLLTLALLEVWPSGRVCKTQLEPVLRQLAMEFHLFGPGGLDRWVDVKISEILVVMNHTRRLTNPLRWAQAIARLGDKEIAMMRAVVQKLGPGLAEELAGARTAPCTVSPSRVQPAPPTTPPAKKAFSPGSLGIGNIAVGTVSPSTWQCC